VKVFLHAVRRERHRQLRQDFSLTRVATGGDRQQCEKYLRMLRED
jgi:hypothetical protein